MFSKHVGKINLLLLDRRDDNSSLRNSFTIRCSRTSRHNQTVRNSVSTPKPRYESEISLIKKDIPDKYQQLLQDLFKAKCSALSIDFNKTSLQSFLKAFMAKNKFNKQQLCDGTINLSELGLNDKSMPQINVFLKENPSLIIVKLSKNIINPNSLARLQTIKELSLGNCRLGNQYLELLFTKLHASSIEKLCLSSPQVKNRNQLTKYKVLISLIQSTKTLATLQLGNMDILPDCLIIESCKNSTVKHLDLSDNTNVKGNCNTLLSLNLTRNAITVPFAYPMLPNQFQTLNLSYNKIPHNQFKQFLKYSYFSNIKKLILDYNKLSEELLCFQLFIEQTPTLTYLSLVGCDLGQGGFLSIAHGVKVNRSLQFLNLSWNRILNEKVADYVSHMLQGCILKEIKLRHCDIKDGIGQRIFRNIRRNKTLQKIDMMNNLLGDKTAKAICNELKYAKSIIAIQLQSNIIKFSDIRQIQGYLESNKYQNGYQLDKQYQKLIQTNTQLVEANVILNSEAERISRLEKQTEELHLQYLIKFKVDNVQRKKKLRNQIYNIRDSENQLMTDITLMQALPSLQDLNSMESRKESFISNHQSFTNL